MRRLAGFFLVALCAPISLVLFNGGVVASAAPAAPTETEPWLLQKLAASASDANLIVFVAAVDATAARTAAESAGLHVLSTYASISSVAANGSPAQIRSLISSNKATWVQGNKPLTPLLDTANVATRAVDADAGLKNAVGEPLQGQGITIAEIDSGVDGTHPMFQNGDGKSAVVRNMKLACGSAVSYASDGRPYPFGPCNNPTVPVAGTEIASQPNDTFFADISDVNDTDTPSAGGHGTHVAGIAVGRAVVDKVGRHLQGAAPRASLVALSVGASDSVYGSMEAFKWVEEHHAHPCEGSIGATADCAPIRVVTNSYGPSGGGPFAFNPNEVVAKIQDVLVSNGITVVWANGNDGGDGTVNNSNPPGQDPTPGIISVANYDDGSRGYRDGLLDSSSSRGLKADVDSYPDISAPGSSITSACRPQLTICSTGADTNDPDYNSISGTSMATPYIAGVAARVLSVNPNLTPAQIETILENTAYKFGDAASYRADDPARNPTNTTSFDKGHGLVDVSAALASALDTPTPAAYSCPANKVVIDPAGDATEVAATGTTPAPSEPALDVLSGTIRWDQATTALDFEIKVTDSTPPNPGPGHSFRFYFGIHGAEFQATARRVITAAPGPPPTTTETTTFSLARYDSVSLSTVTLGTVTGSWDDATDIIRIHVPNHVGAGANALNVAVGDWITGSEVLAQRPVVLPTGGSVTLTADTARGIPCTYVVGTDLNDPDPVVPEVPFAAALPLAGLAGAGVVVATRRRRRRAGAAA